MTSFACRTESDPNVIKLVNIRPHHTFGKKVRDTDEVILYNMLHGEYFRLLIQHIKSANEK